MRKIVFTLRPNMQGLNTNLVRNLDISTHKGARLTVYYDRPTVLNVTDDEMSDSELQTWYRVRYSGFGLGIKLVTDETPSVSVSQPKVTNVVSVQDNKKPVVEPKEIPKKVVPVIDEIHQTKMDVAEPDVKVTVETIEPEKVNESESSSMEDNSDLTNLLFGSMLNETTVTEKPVETPEIKGSKVEAK